MKRQMLITAALITWCAVFQTLNLRAHCQIPCGIYDDDVRFTLMLEHVTTIEKSMMEINKLGAEKQKNFNQIVRWVNNKETHAAELTEIVTFYFMAQRLKPVDPKKTKEYQEYVKKLTLLHQIMVNAMKAKQTTDVSYCKTLRELIGQFKKAYQHK